MTIPTGEVFKAKICQDKGKAMMTNPNEALAPWILRTVLGLEENELLTYKKLKAMGTDSVKIVKHDISNYSIEFADLDSYEEFIDYNE